jgi:putative Mn2+ efflux pump MntP
MSSTATIIRLAVVAACAIWAIIPGQTPIAVTVLAFIAIGYGFYLQRQMHPFWVAYSALGGCIIGTHIGLYML